MDLLDSIRGVVRTFIHLTDRWVVPGLQAPNAVTTELGRPRQNPCAQSGKAEREHPVRLRHVPQRHASLSYVPLRMVLPPLPEKPILG